MLKDGISKTYQARDFTSSISDDGLTHYIEAWDKGNNTLFKLPMSDVQTFIVKANRQQQN